MGRTLTGLLVNVWFKFANVNLDVHKPRLLFNPILVIEG